MKDLSVGFKYKDVSYGALFVFESINGYIVATNKELRSLEGGEIKGSEAHAILDAVVGEISPIISDHIAKEFYSGNL